MRPISPKFRKRINEEKYFRECVRQGLDCRGRITIEHAFMYSGRQIDEMWNFVPLCVYHHLGDGLDKGYNQWVALSRATDEDLKKYHKTDWGQTKKYLDKKYESSFNNNSYRVNSNNNH